MDDCILSEPGGDGGGTTLTNVAEAFQGMSNALNQVGHILHTAISQKNDRKKICFANKQNIIPPIDFGLIKPIDKALH